MTYNRPKSGHSLSPNEKRGLLGEYFDYYRKISAEQPNLLNSKLPREAYAKLLDEIGMLLLRHSATKAHEAGEVSEFLDSNPLPEHLSDLLPKEFRAYCLALNALKQWVSAEQAATDRYIFGGTVRKQCRELTNACIISGRPSSDCTIELHHPVRDGRPPIPVSKEAHAVLENQGSSAGESDEIMEVVYPIKRAGNRSWIMLKLGCELLLGGAVTKKSKNVQSSSKTFARKVKEATGMDYSQILVWIDQNNLVRSANKSI